MLLAKKWDSMIKESKQRQRFRCKHLKLKCNWWERRRGRGEWRGIRGWCTIPKCTCKVRAFHSLLACNEVVASNQRVVLFLLNSCWTVDVYLRLRCLHFATPNLPGSPYFIWCIQHSCSSMVSKRLPVCDRGRRYISHCVYRQDPHQQWYVKDLPVWCWETFQSLQWFCNWLRPQNMKEHLMPSLHLEVGCQSDVQRMWQHRQVIAALLLHPHPSPSVAWPNWFEVDPFN